MDEKEERKQGRKRQRKPREGGPSEDGVVTRDGKR